MAIELLVNNTDLDSITEIELDSEDYKYRIYWNSVYDRWYIDIQDSAGGPLLTGKKLNIGSLTKPHRTFPGELLCLSKTGLDVPATLRTLGDDVILVYVPSAEIVSEIQERGEYTFLDYIESNRPTSEEYEVVTIPRTFEFLNDENFEFLDTEDFELIGYTRSVREPEEVEEVEEEEIPLPPVIPFSPNDIPNLELWMDGDSGFIDLSDNALSIGGTEDTITAGALNGHDVFTYDGTAYNSVPSQVTDPTELYIAMVVVGATSAEHIFFAHRSEITRLIQCTLQDTVSELVTRSSGNSISSLPAADTYSTWGIREFSFQKTAQQVVTPEATGNGSVNYGVETFNSSIWTIGGYNLGSYIPDGIGDIAFLAVYSSTPSAPELIELNTYLKDRFAL